MGDIERAPFWLSVFGIRLHFGQRNRHHRIGIIRTIVLVVLSGCGGRGGSLLEGRGGRGGRGVGGFHGRDLTLTQVQQEHEDCKDYLDAAPLTILHIWIERERTVEKREKRRVSPPDNRL